MAQANQGAKVFNYLGSQKEQNGSSAFKLYNILLKETVGIGKSDAVNAIVRNWAIF